MKAAALVLVAVLAVSGAPNQETDGTGNGTANTIELVHVFFRHGARTPELKDVYPSDPYKSETFKPMGWGQLTDYGKHQAYTLGKNLRRRYDSFLANNRNYYVEETVKARSTDYDRTRMSAIFVLAGLLSPPLRRTGGKERVTFAPVSVSYDENDEDFTLRRPNSYCPVYLRELVKALQSEPVKDFLKEHKALMEYVQENSGKPMNKLLDAFSIYQTLTAERTMNLTLPEWSKSVYPHGITEVAAKQCEIENSNAVLKRLNGGRSLKMVVDNMVAKSKRSLSPPQRKMFLYSGHENNVINVLAAMNLYETHFPSYSSAVIIELHRLKEKEHAVKVLYAKNVNEEAEEQQLEGCDVLCPLPKFIQIVKPHLPVNYTKECESKIDLDSSKQF